MRSIPALGFATRTDAALALKAQGLGSAAIARQLGISPNAASGLISSARRTVGRGGDGASVSLSSDRDNPFPSHIRFLLRPAAARRGLSVDRLISDLIAVIAEDGLADAILDDERQDQS